MGNLPDTFKKKKKIHTSIEILEMKNLLKKL